jgi:hypothetical protein
MSETLQVWLMILATAVAVSVLIQLAMLIAIGKSIRRIAASMDELRHMADWQAVGNLIREKSLTVGATLETINRITANLEKTSDTLKSVAEEAGEVSRRHIARTDRFFTRVEQIGGVVQGRIGVPLRKARAISRGLLFAVALLVRRNPAAPQERISP